MGICVEDSVTNHGAVIFHVELTCLLIGRKEFMSSILCMFVIIIIIIIIIAIISFFPSSPSNGYCCKQHNASRNLAYGHALHPCRVWEYTSNVCKLVKTFKTSRLRLVSANEHIYIHPKDKWSICRHSKLHATLKKLLNLMFYRFFFGGGEGVHCLEIKIMTLITFIMID